MSVLGLFCRLLHITTYLNVLMYRGEGLRGGGLKWEGWVRAAGTTH